MKDNFASTETGTGAQLLNIIASEHHLRQETIKEL